MEKIRLGKTDMMVTKLGYGGIPIQRIAEDEAIAVVKKVIELGITFIDTANAYTNSEERIGKAISGQRERLIIATKTLARTAEGVAEHLDLSLKRLGTDYIDLYQFHNVSNSNTLEQILKPEGPMTIAEKEKGKGRIRHIGVSSHQIDTAIEIVKSDRFETIMFPFNFISDEAAIELIPLARKHDVGFIAMKSMAGGMIDNASIAFKFFSQFPDVLPIPGIEKVTEIEEIIRILEAGEEMTEAERQEMQRIKQDVGSTFCRRCEYCQPCTAEIPISTVMQFASIMKRMPPQRIFTGRIAASLEKAAECVECGDCEERCPYHLPIMEMIGKNAKWYQIEKRMHHDIVSSA
jgi:predicted aldo/keto reductase-like oxidoreductase